MVEEKVGRHTRIIDVFFDERCKYEIRFLMRSLNSVYTGGDGGSYVNYGIRFQHHTPQLFSLLASLS